MNDLKRESEEFLGYQILAFAKQPIENSRWFSYYQIQTPEGNMKPIVENFRESFSTSEEAILDAMRSAKSSIQPES